MKRRVAVTPVLLIGLAAMCGCSGNDQVASPDQVVTVSPHPEQQQEVIGLALTAKQHGHTVQIVDQNSLFTVEAGSRCTITELACPRPSLMSWRVSGAFCEALGDTSGPSIAVLCTGYGVTRVEATDLETKAEGVAQIQVLFAD